ncbi:hypothetical protein I2486_15890 [Cellulophaga sp. E16_2]|nr:hypothetical protein [Cellulophaga sp. E16_2]MBO0592886.1 hypothetical protein [Cellulophaga sp. E16_2]
MKYIFIILLFLFISCNGQKNNTDTIKNSEEKQSPTTIDGQNRLEKELHYIKQRNSNVDYFKNKEINDKIGHQMNDSILALEKLLKNILSTTRIPNLTKNGQINLQTFYPEMGFGMLDGLWVEKEETMLLCISDYIFYDFFPEYKFENLSPS